MEYKISSRDYLSRARSRLSDSTLESLFYAAFELRSGIEARMSEYLEAWNHISKKKKKGWRIADLGRNVEEAFKTGNKIIRWAVHSKETGQLVVCFYYTPITSKLKEAGEKLGNYVHSMKKYRNPSDPFWLRFRNELEDIYAQLETANKGTLLGPPLMKSGTKQVDMKLELPPDTDTKALIDKVMIDGQEIKVEVSYLAHLPSTLENEAHVWNISS